MLNITNVRDFINGRIGGEITIQQHHTEYIVVSTPLRNKSVFEQYCSFADTFACDVLFSKSNVCHISSNALYDWPSRKLSRLVEKSIRTTISKLNLSDSSAKIAIKCVSMICQFGSTLFIPGVRASETMSWIELRVDLGDVHLADLQYVFGGFDEAVVDVCFTNGELMVKIRRHSTKRLRDGEEEKKERGKIQ